MADKIDSVTLPNSQGVDTTYDIDLPSDATPSIASLTTSGNVQVGGNLTDGTNSISVANIVAKQNALETQTAYTQVGSATAVPRITTNSLGQVTAIDTVTISGENYYPTAFSWTNGTSSGPTGSLTGSGMNAVSFPAIPSASNSTSGVVTTGAQTFAGAKTLTSDLTLYAASGDSPAIVFQRGTLTDAYNDWKIVDSGGYLYFKQKGQPDSDFTNVLTIQNNGTTTLAGDLNVNNLKPRANNTYDLGDFTANWNNGYFKTLYENGSVLSATYAVKSHASSGTDYGIGTTSNYGHVKLATGDMNGAANEDGVAVSKNHTHSQYANQNAFSTISVGSTNVNASSTTDALGLNGSNVTLTPDATNKTVTIGITSSNVTSALGYTPADSSAISNVITSDSDLTEGFIPIAADNTRKIKDSHLEVAYNSQTDTTTIQASDNISLKTTDSNQRIILNSSIVSVNGNLMPTSSNSYDLGGSSSKWRNLSLNGYISDGKNNSYGLTLPNTTSFTANKTIATTSDLPEILDLR